MKTQAVVANQQPANRIPSTRRPEQPVAMSMRRVFVALFLCVATVASLPAIISAQDQSPAFQALYKSDPLRDNTPEQAMQESVAGSTIPMWPYSLDLCVTFQGIEWCQGPYNGGIMGAAPASNVTTNIPTYIIPLIVKLGSYTFDPTVPDAKCFGGKVPLDAVQKSPMFNNSGPFKWGNPPVNFGTTQYVDALQRAEWYPGDASYGNWHTIFQVHTTSTQTFTPTSGVIYGTPCGGMLAAIDINELYTYVRNTLIPSLSNQGVTAATFPVIVMYNVVETDSGSCCILGYHLAYGSPMQVVAWSMFDTSGLLGNSQDITALSHELAEAVNDPTGVNPAPPWGSGCQTNFEVGDPLVGVLYPSISLNGYTYHPQELAMMPWFYHKNTGLGWTSTNGTFKGYSNVCYQTAPYTPTNVD
jgi:hypothetical protein